MKLSNSANLSALISISLASCASPVVIAQATQENSELVEEVVVLGKPIRDSQKAAIDAKRDSDNYVDVISADTIGRFPDQNLADALGRVPGLAIERDQGQARYINFRGAPFRYTAIAVDGIDLPGAENGRIPRFDSFPAVITSRVSANKAILPNMPGESVAGFIDIETASPFDREGWTLSADIGTGTQQLGDGDIQKYSMKTSWSNEQFGFSLFTSHNSRAQITDNREYDLAIDEASGELLVYELDFRSYRIEREDNAYGGQLEYRFAEDTGRVFVSTLYSEFIDSEERNQYLFEIGAGASAINSQVAPGSNGYQPLALVSRLLEDGEYSNSTAAHTLGLDLELGSWSLSSRLNLSNTENSIFLPIPYSAGGMAAVSYDMRDLEDPQLQVFAPFTQDAMPLSAIEYAADLGLALQQSLDNDTVKFKLDAETELALFDLDGELGLGIQLDRREASGVGSALSFGAFPADTVDITSFDTGRTWDTGLNNSIGGTYYDNAGLFQAWSNAVGDVTAPVTPDQIIEIDEDIAAAYAMHTTEFTWGNLVVGARVEATDYASAGIEGSVSDDFINVLPSAHANIDLSDDLKLRLSASSGISRPTYTEWRASARVDPTNRTVEGGNPYLEAEEAWGGDASLEWYFADASLFSVGAFFRNVENVIYADSTTIDGGDYLASAAGESWIYTGFVNGNNGNLQGLELNLVGQADSFLPDAFSGFGFSGNITVLDSEFDTLSGTSFSLPGTSDLIYNASVFYETSDLSIRLNHMYRDDWLSTTENDAMAEYWAGQSRYDLSASYTLPLEVNGAQLSIYAQANNLTDEVDVRYEGDARTPNQVEGYGRRYLVGFRINY